MNWILVDDAHEEAESYAEMLSLEGSISVSSVSVKNFLDMIASDNVDNSGVLMDVDLSKEAGVINTGPGIAQSIRNDQQAGKLPSFPIARFSAPDRIKEFIGTDSSSDDLFDLMIEKAGFSERFKRDDIRSTLLSTQEVYGRFEAGEDLLEVLRLSDDQWALWGHQELLELVERVERTYQKSLPISRVLSFPGLLIDQELLAIRLGIDRESSKGWADLVGQLSDFRYEGAGSEHLERWWSKGLNNWWTDCLAAPRPLSGTSISERIETLTANFADLNALSMPPQSLGDRPWRLCKISEMNGEGSIPVDPSKSVKMTLGVLSGSWMDPAYAALGPALESRTDPRLSKSDLKKLEPLARSLR